MTTTTEHHTVNTEPGDCHQPHRYRIYCAALDAIIGGTFTTAQQARTQYNQIPEHHEPIWDVIHPDGSQCVREAQRQEILSFDLDPALNPPRPTPVLLVGTRRPRRPATPQQVRVILSPAYLAYVLGNAPRPRIP